MKTQISANLYRLVSAAASTEETRYYLNGVYVEPHQLQGVVLVATDGHRMLVAHDPDGVTDIKAIVRLSKDALKLCKRPKYGKRLIAVDYQWEYKGTARIFDQVPDGDKFEETPVGVSTDCVVDGTFPDWRRVLPIIDPAKLVTDSYSGRYLAAFGEIGREFYDEEHDYSTPRDFGRAMQVFSSGTGNPSLVRWSAVDRAFGVLMPIRGDIAPAFPEFLNAAPPAMAEAA